MVTTRSGLKRGRKADQPTVGVDQGQTDSKRKKNPASEVEHPQARPPPPQAAPPGTPAKQAAEKRSSKGEGIEEVHLEAQQKDQDRTMDEKQKSDGEEEKGTKDAGEKQGGDKPAGGDAAQDSSENHIEQGRIYFFYRPKVSVEEAEGLHDVQRFYMLLAPNPKGDCQPKARLGVIGKKKLPATERKERMFGFIEACAEKAEDLIQGLGPKRYETKTRGERFVGGARAAGEGTYSILPHHGHTHLAYTLIIPDQVGPAQEQLHISQEGSYIFTIKNPQKPGSSEVGLKEKAEYGDEKQKEFQNYAWIPVNDPQLLDTERCEFLLVGAADDLKRELGEAGAEVGQAAADVKDRFECAGSDEECMLQKLKDEIKAEESGIEAEPAATGDWK